MNYSRIYKIFWIILISYLLGMFFGIVVSCPPDDEPDNEPEEAVTIDPPDDEITCDDQILVVKKDVETIKNLGEFVVTAYCPCKGCSDEYGRQTSTGVTATEGRTIAVDPKVIPYGTEVIVNGCKYVAEDCGGAIKQNKIDIFFEDHQDTVNFGVQRLPVSIVVRSDEV